MYPIFFLSFMYITIMYYYYFNLHVMHVFLHLYKYYYYVLCSTIYYILLLFFISCIVHLYLYIPKTKIERIIKKISLYILSLYFFICRNKNTWIKILSNDIVFVYPWIAIHLIPVAWRTPYLLSGAVLSPRDTHLDE